MKMVTAIIRPERLDDVIQALEAIGIEKLTMVDVSGIGRTRPVRGPDEPRRTPLPARRKLEVAVPVERVSEVIAAIRMAAATGKPGDGKIFVVALDAAVRIRSFESGATAL